ncbi:limonene-1,2-epoxide hydrolase family protein [Streptomyces sp. JW3]|uniref:limonene-1,2-epoxide hydrolase family protein n=1 Tax=Streptomyces sp. JW3 TaxID=3456955 RepID=UPI003FA4A38F
MPATDAERVVHAFLTGMGPTPDDIRRVMDGFLTDDCVWQNPGAPVCRGKRDILALLPPDFARLEVRFRHLATAGDTVLAERTESMYRADGSPIARHLNVMAAFELRAGRISAWRDYYDHTHLISERPDW